MEKRRLESYPVLQIPMKFRLDELFSKQQIKETAEALEPLDLTRNSRVMMQGNNVSVMREKAVKQVEWVGNAGFEFGEKIVELRVIGVGKVENKITIVDKFVLPKIDEILAVKQNFQLPNQEKHPSYLEKLLADYEYADVLHLKLPPPDTITTLIGRVINYGRESDIKLLENYQNRFPDIFVRNDISIDKILKNSWKMVAHHSEVIITNSYREMVMKAGGGVFDLHTHPRGASAPSICDIFIDAGPRQRFEWAAILSVTPSPFWKSEISETNLAAYYSNINDTRELANLISELSYTGFLGKIRQHFKEGAIEDDFRMTHKAVMSAYGKLLDEARKL